MNAVETIPADAVQPLPIRRVAATWWPLSISWMLMSAEPAIIAAAVARLANPSIHLAAYGSVTAPLCGILQAPILTLLSLSTTMSKDWDSYQKGRKLMFILGGGLTLLYMAITFTPLYYFVVEKLIDAPAEVVEPARLGMFVGLPWTFAVAYRRFHQGVLIRFEHTRAISVGTLIRFAADALVLVTGLTVATIPGTVVATLMMVVGVTTEAVYVGLIVRPVLRKEVRRAPALAQKVRLREMVLFFIPLGIMPLLNQLVRPIGSAGLSRMANPLVTLAVWPVIATLSALIITPGAAYNEVVIAMLDRDRPRASVERFMFILMGAQLAAMLLLSFTPLTYLYFSRVSGLAPDLARQAASAFILLIPMALATPLNSYFTGALLHSRLSRGVTEGMAVYLVVYIGGLALGGAIAGECSLQVAVIASLLASIMQTSWLGIRARRAIRELC